MQVLFAEFTIIVERKIELVMQEPLVSPHVDLFLH